MANLNISVWFSKTKYYLLFGIPFAFQARDLSPTLVTKSKIYLIHLLDYCKEGAMPIFLIQAPNPLKVEIMGDMYADHLKKCYVFEGINYDFLKQLAARFERQVFFPGDYIVEKGDVDHSMYFVHLGEVYCMEQNKEYSALERPTYLVLKGEYFGIESGFFLNFPHENSYRAKTLSEVLVLHKDYWKDMREAFPHILTTIHEKILKRTKFAQTFKKL